MIVNLNNSMYEMSDKEFKGLVKAAKSNFKNENVIVAITKGGISIMTKEIFVSTKLLYKAIEQYKTQGFKIHYTKKVK